MAMPPPFSDGELRFVLGEIIKQSTYPLHELAKLCLHEQPDWMRMHVPHGRTPEECKEEMEARGWINRPVMDGPGPLSSPSQMPTYTPRHESTPMTAARHLANTRPHKRSASGADGIERNPKRVATTQYHQILASPTKQTHAHPTMNLEEEPKKQRGRPSRPPRIEPAPQRKLLPKGYLETGADTALEAYTTPTTLPAMPLNPPPRPLQVPHHEHSPAMLHTLYVSSELPTTRGMGRGGQRQEVVADGRERPRILAEDHMGLANTSAYPPPEPGYRRTVGTTLPPLEGVRGVAAEGNTTHGHGREDLRLAPLQSMDRGP